MSQPPYPGTYYGPQPLGTNTMSILALIFAFVFSPLGIVFGHIARGQIRRTGEQGAGLATAGLVLGYVFTGFAVLWTLAIIVFVVFAARSGPTG